jgi:high-affinity nickel permease
VVGLIAVIVFVTRSVIGQIPVLQNLGDVVGTLVSGAFLFIIGFINLLIVFGVYHLFRQARSGTMKEEELEEYMQKRGPALELNLSSGFWNWLENLDFETMGFAIVAIFGGTRSMAGIPMLSFTLSKDPRTKGRRTPSPLDGTFNSLSITYRRVGC